MIRSSLSRPVLVGLTLSLTVSAAAQANKPLYENDFQKAAVGAVPEEFLVLDGGFVVAEEGTDKFLELPGAPLETFGVLFGPVEKEDVVVTVRVFATGKGRRFPTFAIGAGGQGGYRLQIAAARKSLELVKGDAVKTSVPFEWAAGKWTQLKLQVRKTGAQEWKIEGKAWTQGSPEPAAWTIAVEEKQDLPSGRSSIWGLPFAGTPIRFDDLRVERTGK